MADTDYLVRDLLTDALLELGVVGVNDPISPEILNVALRRLLGMYSTFQALRLLLFTVARTTYTLTANHQPHTIGLTGCDLTSPRPIWIGSLNVIPVDDPDLELPVTPYTRREWDDERLKTLTDLYPQRFLYEPTTATTGTLTFWPIPTTACQIVIASPVPLVVPSGDLATVLATVLTFAPGYQEAWLYNLAKRLWRVFPKSKTLDYAALVEDARQSLSIVKRLNDEAPAASGSDPALLSRGGAGYDIRSNQNR